MNVLSSFMHCQVVGAYRSVLLAVLDETLIVESKGLIRIRVPAHVNKVVRYLIFLVCVTLEWNTNVVEITVYSPVSSN